MENTERKSANAVGGPRPKKARKKAEAFEHEVKRDEMFFEINQIIRRLDECVNCGQPRMYHRDEIKCLFNSTEFKNSP